MMVNLVGVSNFQDLVTLVQQLGARQGSFLQMHELQKTKSRLEYIRIYKYYSWVIRKSLLVGYFADYL